MLDCDGVCTTDEFWGDKSGGELIVEGVADRCEKLANVSKDTIGRLSH